MLAGGIDSAVRTYDLRAGTLAADAVDPAVTHVALSGDGNCILAASLDARLRLLDLAAARSSPSTAATRTGVQAGVLLLVRRRLRRERLGGRRGHVWDLVEAKQRLRLPAHRAAAVGLACHPTKHELLTASHDGACTSGRCRAAS